MDKILATGPKLSTINVLSAPLTVSPLSQKRQLYVQSLMRSCSYGKYVKQYLRQRQEPHYPAEAHSPSELVGHHAGEHGAQHAANAEDGDCDGPDASEALRRDELAVPVVVRAVHPLFNDLPEREEDGAGQS